MTYIVFQDSFTGFKHIPEMDCDTLKEAVENITEVSVKCSNPIHSQNFMYFIYKRHEDNVPVVGTRFNTYRRVKAIAGSKVSNPQTNSHEYAMTHNSSMAWFFTDNLFE